MGIIPISKGGLDEGQGLTIVWEARLYWRGVIVPRMVTEEELVGADVSRKDASGGWLRLPGWWKR